MLDHDKEFGHVIGVDPGVKGAIAIWSPNQTVEVLRLAKATEQDVANFMMLRLSLIHI